MDSIVHTYVYYPNFSFDSSISSLYLILDTHTYNVLHEMKIMAITLRNSDYKSIKISLLFM